VTAPSALTTALGYWTLTILPGDGEGFVKELERGRTVAIEHLSRTGRSNARGYSMEDYGGSAVALVRLAANCKESTPNLSVYKLPGRPNVASLFLVREWNDMEPTATCWPAKIQTWKIREQTGTSILHRR